MAQHVNKWKANIISSQGKLWWAFWEMSLEMLTQMASSLHFCKTYHCLPLTRIRKSTPRRWEHLKMQILQQHNVNSSFSKVTVAKLLFRRFLLHPRTVLVTSETCPRAYEGSALTGFVHSWANLSSISKYHDLRSVNSHNTKWSLPEIPFHL